MNKVSEPIRYKNSEAGFNLIEATIVLSIISALAGTIVIGRELVSGGKIVAVISELAYFSQAQEQFREQYKYRPGDVPVDKNFPTFTRGFTTPSCGDNALLGDGKWDAEIDDVADFDDNNIQPYEVDYGFNQLSVAGMIKQPMNFDPCSTDGKNRNPGVERPASDIDDKIGYTFINNMFITAESETKYFLYVLRVGAHQEGGVSDMYLRGGAFNAKFHRDIDAKIDQPETPWSGKYVVDENCFDADGYLPESDETKCTGNLVEVDPNTPGK